MEYLQEITLDLNANTAYTTVNAKQGDGNSRNIKVHITENGYDWKIPQDVSAHYRVRKPDGYAIWNPANVDLNENVITFSLSEQALAAAGRAYADIQLSRSSGATGTGREILSTVSFILIIMASPDISKNIISSNEFSTILDLTDNADTILNEAEAWAVGTRGGTPIVGEEFTHEVIGGSFTCDINELIFRQTAGKMPGETRYFIFTSQGENNWTLTQGENFEQLTTGELETKYGITISGNVNQTNVIRVVVTDSDIEYENNSKYYAEQSEEFYDKVQNIGVEAHTATDTSATVTKTIDSTGYLHLDFGLPAGIKGDQGIRGADQVWVGSNEPREYIVDNSINSSNFNGRVAEGTVYIADFVQIIVTAESFTELLQYGLFIYEGEKYKELPLNSIYDSTKTYYQADNYTEVREGNFNENQTYFTPSDIKLWLNFQDNLDPVLITANQVLYFDYYLDEHVTADNYAQKVSEGLYYKSGDEYIKITDETYDASIVYYTSNKQNTIGGIISEIDQKANSAVASVNEIKDSVDSAVDQANAAKDAATSAVADVSNLQIIVNKKYEIPTLPSEYSSGYLKITGNFVIDSTVTAANWNQKIVEGLYFILNEKYTLVQPDDIFDSQTIYYTREANEDQTSWDSKVDYQNDLENYISINNKVLNKNYSLTELGIQAVASTNESYFKTHQSNEYKIIESNLNSTINSNLNLASSAVQKIVLNNTSYTPDSAEHTVNLGNFLTTETIYNKNYLDNAWFGINQREHSNNANVAAGTYFIDRWKVFENSNTTRKITTNTNHLSISAAEAGADISLEYSIIQLIDDSVWHTLSGQKVTMSVSYRFDNNDYKISTWTLGAGEDTTRCPIYNTTPSDNKFGKHQFDPNFGWGAQLTAITIDGKKYLAFKIVWSSSLWTQTSDTKIEINKVKLELGTASTLAQDGEPDRAEELKKCQCYLHTYFSPESSSENNIDYIIGQGVARDANNLDVVFYGLDDMINTPKSISLREGLKLEGRRGFIAATAAGQPISIEPSALTSYAQVFPALTSGSAGTFVKDVYYTKDPVDGTYSAAASWSANTTYYRKTYKRGLGGIVTGVLCTYTTPTFTQYNPYYVVMPRTAAASDSASEVKPFIIISAEP